MSTRKRRLPKQPPVRTRSEKRRAPRTRVAEFKAASEAPFRDWDRLPDSPNCVTIFGAGVAGLTAAHELVERGFRVQVWEPQGDERYPERGCDVGGMARTQWSAASWSAERKLDELPRFPKSFAERQARDISHIAQRFYVMRTAWKFQHVPSHLDQEALADHLDRPDALSVPELRDAALQIRGESKRCRIRLLTANARDLSKPELDRYADLGGLVSEDGPIDFSPDENNRRSVGEYAFWLKTPSEAIHVEVRVAESNDPDGLWVALEWLDAYGRPLTSASFRSVWQPTPDNVYGPRGLLESDDGKKDLKDLAGELGHAERLSSDLYFEVASDRTRPISERERKRRERALRACFEGAGYPLPEKLVFKWLDRWPYAFYDDVPTEIDIVVGFRVRERWLPGEHGYRFFPSFYHHLFDTMKRTPLLEVDTKPEFAQAQERAQGITRPEPMSYVESTRTAYDNLVPTTSYALAFANGQRASELSRFAVSSFEELREYVSVIFGSREQGGFGLAPRDAARIGLKVLQFATSCDGRRREYEKISWWDFLGADSLSPNAQVILQRLPEALVAMDAKECDARTQWVPLIQILLDQARKDRYRDGTLRGPTSEAWLNPWRRYLESQGVEFVYGRITDFEIVEMDDGEKHEARVWPKVECFDPRYSATNPPQVLPGYFVLAVSADNMRDLAGKYLKAIRESKYRVRLPDESDFVRAEKIGGDLSAAELERELREARPNADFRHFAGIQYYFAEDVFWIDGHVYYPDSPWAITSISQARFWQDKMDWEHGYRGVLSAIIGAWDVKGLKIKKEAWACTEAELAEEVWFQISEGIQRLKQRRDGSVGRFVRRTPVATALPEPIFWQLDRNLKRVGGQPGYTNGSPFLIAAPGRFDERPGRLDVGYTVEHGFVMAGYYTQTHTRIPSMEAANESARHAVNAILRHLEEKQPRGHEFRRTYCDIWNPEDREIDDLNVLKRLDEALLARGLPHLMEVMDLDSISANLLRGGADDPLDPLGILARFRAMARP